MAAAAFDQIIMANRTSPCQEGLYGLWAEQKVDKKWKVVESSVHSGSVEIPTQHSEEFAVGSDKSLRYGELPRLVGG